jgi:unsaturated rhamnogalacturonyl hydrolase
MNPRRVWELALCISAFAALSAAATAAPAREQALSLGAKVADWQLAHMSRFDYIPSDAHRRDAESPRDWVQAAFYIGLSHFADATGDGHYADAVMAHGTAQGWGFDGRPRHADADATGAVWIWAAERTHDSSKLIPIKARFDAVIADPSTVSLDFAPGPPEGGSPYCQARWCWSDALFMAPPAWIALSKATGDSRYLAHANQEFWATTDYLYDRIDHLYYRDSRFLTQRDPNGRKIFWGRGNGWVFAGLARILTELPANHPSRARFIALYQQMADAVVSLQGATGYWPVSLLEPQQTPETSGTGFFVYGLAWGIHHGILHDKRYGRAVDRGWQALQAAVQSDGKLGWVQRIGAAPDQVSADDTQLYGVGAFLLAASELATMQPGKHPHRSPSP